MEDLQVPGTMQRFRSFSAHGRAARRVRFLTLLGATAVSAIMLAGFAGSASARGHAQQGPPGLAFYDPPTQLPAGAHGTLIWARTGGGLVPLEGAAHTKLVLYKSRTPQGNVDVVSGSVSVPKGRPPAGGWPVITYAHGTTGAADIC